MKTSQTINMIIMIIILITLSQTSSAQDDRIKEIPMSEKLAMKERSISKRTYQNLSYFLCLSQKMRLLTSDMIGEDLRDAPDAASRLRMLIDFIHDVDLYVTAGVGKSHWRKWSPKSVDCRIGVTYCGNFNYVKKIDGKTEKTGMDVFITMNETKSFISKVRLRITMFNLKDKKISVHYRTFHNLRPGQAVIWEAERKRKDAASEYPWNVNIRIETMKDVAGDEKRRIRGQAKKM